MATAARADNVSLVPSAAAQAANDSAVWSQLGGDGTVIGAGFSVLTGRGTALQTALAGANSVISIVCPSSPCSWNGAGYLAGDALLWMSDLGNGGNGPIVINFPAGVSGAGAIVQADAPGQFTAKVEAFNGPVSLGSFTVSSNANGDATYIGIKDGTAPNVTSVIFSITAGTGNLTDFAIGTLNLNVPTGPAVKLSSSTLSFGNQAVGTTSPTQPLTLTNSGNSALAINSILASGDYTSVNNCGNSLAAGSSCAATVSFTPTLPGARSGSITFTDNASGSPQVVQLTGTGIQTAQMASPSVILPSSVIAPPGDVAVPFPVTLSDPAPSTIFVTLTSSDPTKVALSVNGAASTTFSIAAGQTTPTTSTRIFGMDLGTATITATASGYTSASTAVQVSANISFVPNIVSLNPGTGKKLSIVISAATVSGVNINLSSDNPGVATVPSSVIVPPNATSVLVQVTAGVQVGSTLIHASALPSVPDTTATVVVGTPGPPVITTNSLANGQVGLPYSQSLSATGGIVPLAWTLVGGQLPNGLTLSPSGVISGTPTVTATNLPLTFQVADSASPTRQTATATLTLTISGQGALTIGTTSLPNGVINSAYNAMLTASGGTTPYTWALMPGSTLPNGLTLNSSTGVISGTPTLTVSNLSLTFQATDSSIPNAQTATKTLTLTIGSAVLTVTTTSLADGVINKPYSQQLQAMGGTPPYTWSVTSSRLPSNYFLNASTGMITSDTGTCCVGTFQMTFQVTDAMQQTASKVLSIVIGDGSLQLLTTSLPAGQVGVAYSAPLTAKSGTPPYTWSIGGALPAGLIFTKSSGVISGTPIVAGTSRLQLTVTDASTPTPQTQSVFLNLVVNTGPPVITTTTLPSGVAGNAYTAMVSAAGGTAPYGWSATGLPAGLTMNAITGVISGTPIAAGNNAITVTVKDASSSQLTATANLQINISPPTPISITTASLPNGATNTPYSSAVVATGGTQPYAWTATGLPAGLTINSVTGVIQGTPAAVGTSTATIGVTDSTFPTHQSAVAKLSITIALQALGITTNSLPGGTAGNPYTAALTAGGGTLPYAWSATGLPNGLLIDPVSGIISGTPGGAGTSNVSVTVTDSTQPNQTATKSFSLVVTPKLSIMTTVLPNGSVYLPYTGAISVAGGTPPYKYSLIGAPSNLSIGSSGLFQGAPMFTGTFLVTVTVSDASVPQQTASANYTITIVNGLTITTTGLPNGKVGASYTTVMTVSGDQGRLSWSAVGLPPGISINQEYGVVQGIPLTAGTFQSSFTVMDKANQVATTTLTFVINP